MADLSNLRRPEGASQASKRLGRGPGSGLGKTSGRGHKGQKARTGGSVPAWFEGGQMPLQRRLPKIGFKSRSKTFSAEVRLSELNKLAGSRIDIHALKLANLIPARARSVKVIDSGQLNAAVTLVGIKATKGARAKIEAAGGSIEV